jgi:thioredoxin reductase (NADPH)
MGLETLTASDSNTFDILIVGGGPAALTAAIYARKANFKVGFIEKDIPGGKVVNLPNITNYSGFKSITGADLALNMYTQATDLGAKYIYGKVTGIVKRQNYHVAFLENGVNYFTRALIIATGTTEIKLNVPGENEYHDKGVSYCALCDGSLTKGKTVVLFGGDNIAIKNAIYLSNIASKIYLIDRNDEFSATTDLINVVKKNTNIEIIHNATCLEIKGDKQQVTSVDIKVKDKTMNLPTNYVFIFVGSNSESGFLTNIEHLLNPDGTIVVDEYKQTPVKGIFAAGDVTKNIYRQISTAVGDGALAALSAIKYIKEE